MKKAAINGRYLEKLVHFSTLLSSFAVIATSKWAEEEEETVAWEGWQIAFLM